MLVMVNSTLAVVKYKVIKCVRTSDVATIACVFYDLLLNQKALRTL